MTAEEIAQRDTSHMRHLRELRDEKLVASDWTHLSDYPAPLTAAKRAEWATYRQSLRDLPATADMTSWPDVWTTEPL